jgi:carbonic anhydrase
MQQNGTGSRKSMPVSDLTIDWADLVKITVSEIPHALAREFIRNLRLSSSTPTTDVYVCSDARNKAVRQILKHLPNVNVLINAGNVVYSPNKIPTVVIAHGSHNYKCGAVEYAGLHKDDPNAELPSIAKEVCGDPIENAKAQLDKVDEEFRAGIIYFDHALGTVEKITNNDYARSEVCDFFYKELDMTLKGRHTAEEIMAMSVGQNPEIIFFTNFSTRNTAYDLFRINVQKNKFHGVVRDSFCFAMGAALTDEESFRDTRTTILAFKENDHLPEGIEDFLNEEALHRGYIDKGGRIYLASIGGLPSQKRIYEIRAHK